MNSVAERLIESWLDSQSERRYQPAFIQLLASQGWTVLHSTRHSPIELGKDVIARDPSGQLYAFQLKGNPGQRLRKSEAQGLLPQLIELVDLPCPIGFRKSRGEKHIGVLVTNGEVDEEARVAFDLLSERTTNPSSAAMRFDVWGRGELLAGFAKFAGSIWPSSVEGTRRLLGLLAVDGRDQPEPIDLALTLELAAPRPSRSTSSAARTADLTAMLLLAEVAKAPYYAENNHYSLFVVTVLAAVQGLRFADTTRRSKLVAKYADLALEHAADLVEEAKSRRFDARLSWAERDLLSEVDIQTERRRLVVNCASTLVLAGRDTAEVAYVSDLVRDVFDVPLVWGHGAIPSLILNYWAWRKLEAGEGPDKKLAEHLRNLVRVSQSIDGSDNGGGMTPPYYSFFDYWAKVNDLPLINNDSIVLDSGVGRAWFLRSVLYMLAKRNWKQTCKAIWPEFTKLVHEEPQLPFVDFFDARHSTQGHIRNYLYDTITWEELISQATDTTEGVFLKNVTSTPWLIAAYISIVPYRAWNGVVMWVDGMLFRTWYT